MPWDPASGLAYSEKILSVNQMKRNTIWSCRGQQPRYESPTQGGTHSLRHLATRHLLCNLDNLTLEALQAVPTLILESLWTKIRRADLDSQAIWQLFASTGQFGRTFVKRSKFSLSSISLSALASASNSPSLSWLTDLTLGHLDRIDHPEGLSHLNNLRSLNLQSASSHEDYAMDRMVRTWSDSAKYTGAFQNLEILLVMRHDAMASHQLERLAHMCNFPSLDTYICSPGGGKQSAVLRSSTVISGWHYEASTAFMHELHTIMHELHTIHDTRLYSKADFHLLSWTIVANTYLSHKKSQATKELDGLPVLNLSLSNLAEKLTVAPDTLIHLQRDWQNQPAPHTLQRKEGAPASKKRKLKPGKALALDNVLDNLLEVRCSQRAACSETPTSEG